ncbi:MAG TPA: hypothetical protein VHP83_05200 [Aggregatilineaceae bacterium]|nr:hypothetical protein [Aggregatilineaceae bacterium]
MIGQLKKELLDVLDETFEHVNGIYLDRGTSLFETLNTISAEVASRPVGWNCASIAAQVEHVRFYLDVLERSMLNQEIGKVDWGEIWRTVHEVTPEEWEASKKRVWESYQRVRRVITGFETWEGKNDIAGTLAILVHTAYHLGEIRQALCTVRQQQ